MLSGGRFVWVLLCKLVIVRVVTPPLFPLLSMADHKDQETVFVSLCSLRDGNGDSLLFCDKRKFAAAFSLVALLCVSVAFGNSIAILKEKWLVGPSIFVPATAQSFSGACFAVPVLGFGFVLKHSFHCNAFFCIAQSCA
jgi:hypothetical protein